MTTKNQFLILFEEIENLFQSDLVAEEKLTQFCNSLLLIGEHAVSNGFPGLMDVCLMFKEGIEARLLLQPELHNFALELLESFPVKLSGFMTNQDDTDAKDKFIELLCSPAFGPIFTDEDTAILNELLDIRMEAGNENLPVSTEINFENNIITEQECSESTLKAPPQIQISQKITGETRELLEIMSNELVNIYQNLQRLISILDSKEPDAAEFSKNLHETTMTLQFFGEAAHSVEFTGLGKVFEYAKHNLDLLEDTETERKIILLMHLLACVELIFTYLSDPELAQSWQQILQNLQDKKWIEPLTPEKTSELQPLFLNQKITASDPDRPKQKSQATIEDISLEIQDDVDRDLLEAMLQELPDQSEQLTNSLQQLSEGGTTEDILLAKRIAHTLKGAGNTVGIRGVANLTHKMEDILMVLHKHEAMPPPRVAQTLMNAADCLTIMCEHLLGMGEPPDDALEVLQDVFDIANLLEEKGINGLPQEQVNPKQESAPKKQKAEIKPASDNEAVAMMRVPAEFVENLLRMVGETIIMTSQIHTNVKNTLAHMNDVKYCFENLQLLGNKVQELSDIKDLSKIKVSDSYEHFDDLEMTQYSELYTYSKLLTETTVDANLIHHSVLNDLLVLQEKLLKQTKINNDIQESVISTRMVQANIHFQRLQRCVRQATKLTGKQVELHCEGGHTLLDNETLNKLIDPLMHVLRNAIDHGIEDFDIREQSGKSPTGNIYLTFGREGNDILIKCQDDGGGLDFDTIRQKAIADGIFSPEQDPGEEELKQLILQPSFSTKQEVTQVSGRGIGMDAVYSTITSLSGSLKLDSEKGKGCLITIKIPQNLLSVYALLVRVGPRILALSTHGIMQIVHHENGSLQTSGNDPVFITGDHKYSAIYLEDLLGLQENRRKKERNKPTAIIFESESGNKVVLVEKIVSSNDIVVKGLGDFIPKINGTLGVTILGDGSVCPVIDVPDLLRTPLYHKNDRYIRQDFQHQNLPSALVVDDSLSARRSLVQFMQDLGYEVRQARDGIEALDIIQKNKPDILLTDLEMPRMNGMELTMHLRADNNLLDLPIIMITSRAIEKHRQEAITAGVNSYLGKPYQEDELMEEVNRLTSKQ